MRHVLRLHYFNTLTPAAIFIPCRRLTLTRPSHGLFATTFTGRLDESRRVGGSVVKSVELTGAHLPVADDLVGGCGSTDPMILTALTVTRIWYGCTVVRICRQRMRPWIRSARALQYGGTLSRRIYGARRVCARMLRVGERAMDGDRRVRILLLLDRAAAPLAGRPADDEHQHRQHRGSPGPAPGSHQ